MFLETPVLNPPMPAPRTGTYGLATPQTWGAAHRLLFPTQNTPPAPGDLTTPLNTYSYGTNPWPLPTYPVSRQPTSTNLRSSPSTILTANRHQYMNNQPIPGWSYPILIMPTEPSFKDEHSSNDPGDASPQNPTPWTQTPRSPTSSTTKRSGSPPLVDLIHFNTITMDN